jgi:hypothetical protein
MPRAILPDTYARCPTPRLLPALAVVLFLAAGTPAEGAAQARGAEADTAGAAGPAAAADTVAPAPGPGAGPAEGLGGAPGRVDGFWGLPWHADSAAVAEKLGPPITAGRHDGRLRMFVYTPLYLGRDGFLQLWLHDDRGLLAGTWEPMTSDCTGMLRRLVRETREAHPGVPSRTEGRVTRSMMGSDICVAAMEQGASVTVIWEDPRGTRIAVGTTPRAHKLRMRVSTSEFREIAGKLEF